MLILGLGRALQVIVMFASYRFLSSLFSAAELSSYYFLLSISGLFGLLIANPMGMYLNRIIHLSKSNKNLNSAIFFFLKIFLISSSVVLPIIFIFRSKIDESQIDIFLIALVLLIYVIGATLNGFFISALNILSKNILFVILTTLTAVVGLSFSLFIVKTFDNSPILWMLGQGIATLIFGLIAVIMIKKIVTNDNLSFKLNKNEFIKFSFPILLTNIFIWIMSQSFRFILKGNVDDSILGEMAFGLGMATGLAVAVEYLFHQLLLPHFYAELDHESNLREESWNKLFLKSAPAFICLAMYMTILSPFIMNVMADAKFKNAFIYFALGSVVELFRMMGSMVNLAFHSEMKTSKSIQSYMLGGTITFVGIIWVSQNVEMLYLTPYILMLGQFLILVSLLWKLKSLIRIKNPINVIAKYLGLSLVFLLAMVIRQEQNTYISLSICFIFGLYLLFLFQKIQKEAIE